MKKKCIMSTIMACLVLGAPAMAAPLQQPQPGDLKVNINYGLQQKEGNHAANHHFVGGDVTYVLSPKWGIQYQNNYVRGNTGNRVSEHVLTGDYYINEQLTAFAGGTYVQAEKAGVSKNSYGYQWGVKGQMQLPFHLQGYARIGVGNKINSYTVGVGYEVLPGIDAHLQYRRSRIRTAGYDDSVHGVQVGMGYKF